MSPTVAQSGYLHPAKKKKTKKKNQECQGAESYEEKKKVVTE
jgi:hypothetical protein